MRDVLLALDVVLALAVVLALETVMVLGVVLGLDPDMGTALMISGHLSNQARSWSNLARDVLGWRGYASRGTMSSGCWSSSIPVIHTGYARNVRVLGNRYIDHRPCEEEIDPWTTPGLPLDYPWTTPGLPLDYPWTTTGLPLDYHWTTPGLPLDYPWTTPAGQQPPPPISR
jgi:hypothetical protein